MMGDGYEVVGGGVRWWVDVKWWEVGMRWWEVEMK